LNMDIKFIVTFPLFSRLRTPLRIARVDKNVGGRNRPASTWLIRAWI